MRKTPQAGKMAASLPEESGVSPSIKPTFTRRSFFNRLGLFGLASAFSNDPFLSSGPQAFAAPESGPDKSSHIRNRAPLAPNGLYFLPLGSVRPRGWLKEQLAIQAAGLSGHLEETWADVGPNSGWQGGKGESWERGPYFLDGLIPLAWLLDDSRLKSKAQRYLDWTLEHQAPSGMIGPPSNDDWWPRMV